MNRPSLFRPLRLGVLELRNRIIMAPLTRMRAAAGGVATGLMARYYGQRASAGLIIAEGTAVSPLAHGYPASPGLYTQAHNAAWRAVTDEVHRQGGLIVAQLQHNGRGSLPSYNADASLPVAPSAIRYVGKVYTPAFSPEDPQVPRALALEEVVSLVQTFAAASVNARLAGFDGVEIQGANGHLIDQFLCDGSNQRTDRYGGSVPARAQFLLEIVDAVAAAIGANRVSVRLSPFGQYGGISDSDPVALFNHVIGELSQRNLAYLHLIEARASEIGIADELHANASSNAELFRSRFAGPLISAGAYTPDSAAHALQSGHADAVAFGRLFIANPDLVARIDSGGALNRPNRSTFYGGGAEGYTDYPALGASVEANRAEVSDSEPGARWLELVRRPTLEAFSTAFASGVVFEASILPGPLSKIDSIYAFFVATRSMYDQIAFTDEYHSREGCCLAWEGRFQGKDVQGATCLTFDKAGAIAHVRLFHAPFHQIAAFAAEFVRRQSVHGGSGTTRSPL